MGVYARTARLTGAIVALGLLFAPASDAANFLPAIQLPGAAKRTTEPRVAVTADDILYGHLQQTLNRCIAEGMVYVVTDTTEFCFGRVYREGLGPVTGGYGFLAHVALAVAKSGRVLGVLGFAPWVRPLPDDPEGVARKQMSKRERKS